MKRHYRIKLPSPSVAATLNQDEAYFDLDDFGETRRIRLHAYDEIFARPGLYEQLFHRLLRCASPRMVVGILEKVMTSFGESFAGLNVLDLGAGNGMVGAELIGHGVNRVVGIDILQEARAAAERDRPGVYDGYVVADLTQLPPKVDAELRESGCNAMVSIAALGFGDIPPGAFLKGLSFTSPTAWVAFNLKDSFFGHQDQTGFAALIKRLIADGYFQVFHVERYRHRMSTAGEALHYYAFICRKTADVPLTLADGVLAS